MEEYIRKIIDVCTEAEPAQTMMFDNVGKYILCVEKDEKYVKGIDDMNKVNIAVYEKNAVIRHGRFKDLLICDREGIHVSDLYVVLKTLTKNTEELSKQ